MVAAADEDVVGLDIAVDEPGLVGDVERIGDGGQDSQQPQHVEVAADDQVLQRPAGHEPHRQEQVVLEHARLVDGDDVRMVDAGLDQPFAAKALLEGGIVA